MSGVTHLKWVSRALAQPGNQKDPLSAPQIRRSVKEGSAPSLAPRGRPAQAVPSFAEVSLGSGVAPTRARPPAQARRPGGDQVAP